MNKAKLFSNGNIKVKAPIFNLPAGKTCKSCLSCQKYCYAKKAEVRFPKTVPKARNRNWDRSKQDDFVVEAVSELSRKRTKYVRIHESGDFYNTEYISKWFEIAKQLPNKTFYAYTKRDDLFTDEILAGKPDNFTLIFSIDGIVDDVKDLQVPKGFDKVAVVSNTTYNCPAQNKGKDFKCMLDCTMCADKSESDLIIFKKH